MKPVCPFKVEGIVKLRIEHAVLFRKRIHELRNEVLVVRVVAVGQLASSGTQCYICRSGPRRTIPLALTPFVFDVLPLLNVAEFSCCSLLPLVK